MDFCIKVEKHTENKIVIETPSELGNQISNLLLKEGYTLVEYLPQAIGRSDNDSFDIQNPDMKYYSLMILAQKKETYTAEIAKCIHGNIGGYLSYHGENFLISSDPNDFASF